MCRAHLPIGIVLCLVVLSGCDKKACERYCSCGAYDAVTHSGFSDVTFYTDIEFESFEPGAPDCEEQCEKALDKETLACRSAFRRMAKCLDQLDCDIEECEDPIDDVEIECIE